MTPGQRFGQYEIRRELGRGAMGVVHEAFDRRIGRAVAIKVLDARHQDESVAGQVGTRFRREAEIAGRLVHPNIVAVYGFGERAALADGGELGAFIVMELVAGGDLKARLAGGTRLALREIAQVMGQLLAALRYAHERGVVHRDVKPANLLLRENGRVKLTDFGIARVADSDLTRTGEVMGTVTYMSPEQLTGAAVDARSDLYSCGVVLYEMLTGEPPFVGSTMTVMQKILNQEALPPSSINPTLPKALDAVIRKALAKRPAERFADAKELEQAVAKALFEADDEATLVRPAPAPSSVPPGAGPGRTAAIAAALAAVVALAVVAFVALRPAPSSTALHSPGEIERMAWDRALAADRSAAYEAYLKVYPDGAYAKLAHVHLVALAHSPHAARVEAGRASG